MNKSPRVILLQAAAAAFVAILVICARASPALAEHGLVAWSGPAWYVADWIEEMLLAGPFADEATCAASEAYANGDEFIDCIYFETDPS